MQFSRFKHLGLLLILAISLPKLADAGSAAESTASTQLTAATQSTAETHTTAETQSTAAIQSSNSAGPNILLIMADDCTFRDLEVYGGQAKTPNLNALAADGMKFNKCFQAAPMCSPTRHSLYTGIYPVKSGAYPNHTRAYDWVESIATYLNAADYSTYLSGKTHIGPKSVFPFEYSMGKPGKNPDPEALKTAIEKSKRTGKPFLFIAASNEPHSPWNRGDATQYPPKEIKLPPVLVDSPDTRNDFSNYLAEITYFDGQVGELVGLVDAAGVAEDTLVIVLSEQGNSFPFAKWTCYDVGTHSGCIVRWPNKVPASSSSDALVEYVDIVPTMLDAAGLDQPKVLDGKSFLPVLCEGKTDHKSVVFALQTSRGINDGPEHFGIRSARNDRYIYIRNLTPEVTFQNAMTADPVFKTWRKLAAAGDAKAQELVAGYEHRPAEELFDCEADPWNRVNLIDQPEMKSTVDELRSALKQWMVEQGDEGQATEMKAIERMPGRNKSE